MPAGYAITVGLYTAALLLSVAPLGRRGWRGVVSWFISAIPNESPFLAVYWVAVSTLLAFQQGASPGSAWWLVAAFAAVSLLTAPVIVKRSLTARAVIERALADGLGPGWPGSRSAESLRSRRLPWLRIVLLPLPVLRWDIRRKRNVRYGTGGRHNRLDIYRHRRRRLRGPVLIHLHGGHFRTGRKSFEARPVLHGLAARGWVCISANYRLQPAATYRDQVEDASAVLAWTRANATRLGADPDRVYLAGSSAGANLALAAALLARGEVAGAIGLYGYYGPAGESVDGAGSMPFDYVSEQSPPVLIAHGEQDTLVPARYTTELVSRLRQLSTNAVVYIELPGAQHSFDLVHSVRIETLVCGIDAFAAACEETKLSSLSTLLGP